MGDGTCYFFSDGSLLLPHGYSFGRLKTPTLSKWLQDDQNVSISREFMCGANSLMSWQRKFHLAQFINLLHFSRISPYLYYIQAISKSFYSIQNRFPLWTLLSYFKSSSLLTCRLIYMGLHETPTIYVAKQQIYYILYHL